MYLYPVLPALGALLVLVGEVVKKDYVPIGVRNRPRRMVISGGLLVAIVALLSGIDAGVQQGRLESLAGETKALVTGGNSFVWIRPVEDRDKAERFFLDLAHGGDVVPTFDIEIEVVETKVCDGIEPWTMGQALTSGVGNSRFETFPAFGPQTVKTLKARFEPTCDNAFYLIFIQTRNKVLVEELLLKKVDGKWKSALRLHELYDNKTLMSEVDEGFVAQGEKIKWPDLKPLRIGIAGRFGRRID